MERKLSIFFTADLHGYIYPTDYRGREERDLGLFKCASQFRHVQRILCATHCIGNERSFKMKSQKSYPVFLRRNFAVHAKQIIHGLRRARYSEMMVGDLVNEKQKTKAYSIQSFLCNAGSIVGYLFPLIFTYIGIQNIAPKGQVPDSVIWSFYIGAAILILCVVYTMVNVREMPPEEFAQYQIKDESTGKASAKEPEGAWTVFFQVGVVQFFCWAAFLYMWTYTNGSIAQIDSVC